MEVQRRQTMNKQFPHKRQVPTSLSPSLPLFPYLSLRIHSQSVLITLHLPCLCSFNDVKAKLKTAASNLRDKAKDAAKAVGDKLGQGVKGVQDAYSAAMQKLMPPKFRPAALADDPMATGAEVDRVFAQLSDLIYVSADLKVGDSLQIGYDGACIEVQILFASERDHQLAWVVGIPALRCGGGFVRTHGGTLSQTLFFVLMLDLSIYLPHAHHPPFLLLHPAPPVSCSAARKPAPARRRCSPTSRATLRS